MRWRRIFRIGFIVIACVSLLVNAAIIGIGVNLAKRGWFDAGTRQAWMKIPRESRQTYVQGLRTEKPELDRLRDQLRTHRKTMLTAAGADPVDPAALATAMAEVRAATTQLQAAAHAALLKTVDDTDTNDVD